jgi:hypothetical protein
MPLDSHAPRRATLSHPRANGKADAVKALQKLHEAAPAFRFNHAGTTL